MPQKSRRFDGGILKNNFLEVRKERKKKRADFVGFKLSAAQGEIGPGELQSRIHCITQRLLPAGAGMPSTRHCHPSGLAQSKTTPVPFVVGGIIAASSFWLQVSLNARRLHLRLKRNSFFSNVHFSVNCKMDKNKLNLHPCFNWNVHYGSNVWGHPDNFVSSMKTHFYLSNELKIE